MLFSSFVFLHIYLPLTLLLGFVFKHFQNVVLVVMSLLFYAWGGVSYTAVMLVSIILNYFLGKWISKAGKRRSRNALILGVIINLLILVLFKYLFFLVSNLNLLLVEIGVGEIPVTKMKLPLGVSFFTFQALSYLVDVYRGNVKVQNNFMNLALYISFFPQLIAGPIVRYIDIEGQLKNRSHTWLKFADGAKRFILGLGKKVLLANTFGYVVDNIFAIPPDQLTTSAAWLGMIAYTLQIYFDFSGYSDMAIGLGKMFGFQLPENFNLPYIATSIKEFWRRWHMTLSQWFRDYLYIPLGGNRHSYKRTLFNLVLVFILCGFWHGASWNFILWGALHGGFLVLERGVWGRWLDKAWKPLKHLYTMMVVMFCWVLFKVESMEQFGVFAKALVGGVEARDQIDFIHMLVSKEFVIALIIGVIISTPLPSMVQNWWRTIQGNRLVYITESLQSVAIIAIFIISVMYVSAGSYNPFIYFRF